MKSNNPVAATVAASPHDLPTDALEYRLPERLIATKPVEPRDAARLLVYRRRQDAVEHRHVADLPALLRPRDVLAFNTTAVLPARLVGRRADSGGRVEALYLAGRVDGAWCVMLKSNGKLRPGQRVQLHGQNGQPSDYDLELLARDGEHWIVRPTPDATAQEVLQRIGRTPLPPYIDRARSDSEMIEDKQDRAWYQTIYANRDQAESVAAPTAGLHFTQNLLDAIALRGIERLEVVLHVGLGTFKPVTAPTLAKHQMHTEPFEVPPATLERLSMFQKQRAAAADGPRLIAVGTTTVRTLESLPEPLPQAEIGPYVGETDLLIAPPYDFRHVDGLMTNFHLPRSTLLALVGAMVGLERLREIYAEAIERAYRFYSYGDAMLILP